MTLVLCPDCRAEVSDRAGQCLKCGYPLAVGSTPPIPAAEPDPPRIRTSISRRFALAWTGATGGAVFFMFFLGRVVEPGVAVLAGSLALLASSIPIWWNTHRAVRTGAPPVPADLERRVEERLEAVEEQIRRGLGEMQDGTQQVMDLEERIDFAERLLTKYRDERLRNPSASGESS